MNEDENSKFGNILQAVVNALGKPVELNTFGDYAIF